jgi:hypothetical protein
MKSIALLLAGLATPALAQMDMQNHAHHGHRMETQGALGMYPKTRAASSASAS